MNTCKYGDLRTGDIILFSGRGFIPRFIQLVTWSRWSHCGIIIADDPDYPFPLVYESTHDDSLIGLDLKRHNSGVQIVPFSKRLEMYDGNVAIRRVQTPDYTHRAKLREYRTEVVGRPFEKSRKQIMAAAPVFWWLRQGKDLSSIFCSEHVAETFIALGWLSNYVPSNWYTPKYFAKHWRFRNGVRFGPIEIIK